MPGDLRQRSGQLDSGRAPAHDEKGEPLLPPRWIVLALRRLVGEQHAPPDVDGVLQRLQTGRVLLPFGVAEVGVRGAGRDDEEVVRHHAVAEQHALAAHVDGGRLAEDHPGVLLPAEDAPDGRRDVARVQRRRRYLVEERLEEVVVAPIDQRHLHRSAAQRLGGVETPEPAAQDGHARLSHAGHSKRPKD